MHRDDGSPDDEQIQRWLGRLRDGSPAEKTEARRRLAVVFEQRGMYEEATDLLVANIRAGERSADIFRWLARLYRAQGEEHLAMQAAAESMKYMTPAPSALPTEVVAPPVQYADPSTPLRQGGVFNDLAKVCVVLVALAVGGIILLAVIGSFLPKQPPQERDFEYSARDMCRKFVTDRLRAPATAQFPNPDVQYVSKGGDGSYLVRSYVDSQNGFGANIRTTYRCTVKPVPNTDTWNLISMETVP